MTALPPTACDAHVAALLAAHAAALADVPAAPAPGAERPKRRNAGVLPVCYDEGGAIFVLLAMAGSRRVYSGLHGYVDRGETAQIGAAREAHEESRGVLPLQTTWRACSLPEFSHAVGRRKNVFIINLGPMNAQERLRFTASFFKRRPWSRCSAETAELAFFSLDHIKTLCDAATKEQAERRVVANANDDNNGEADADAAGDGDDEENEGAAAAAAAPDDRHRTIPPIVMNIDAATGLPVFMRGSLAGTLCHRKFWSDPTVSFMMEKRQIPLLSMDQLPVLTDAESKTLPVQ